MWLRRPLRLFLEQLREIEIIIGARLESPSLAEDAEAGITEAERDTLLQMQQILYSTEVRSPSSLFKASSLSTSRTFAARQ